MKYQIYLLDTENHIRAGESFSTTHDTEALEIACSFYDACCDVFAGYEVWRGTHRLRNVASKCDGEAPIRLDDVIMLRQKNISALKERMQRTFQCVGRSRKLIETCDQIRSQWPGLDELGRDAGRRRAPSDHRIGVRLG